MEDSVYHILFFIFSIYALIKCIYYAVFEIKNENNKSCGIATICFSILVVIFSNVVVLLK